MKKILVVLLIVGFVFSCSNAFAFLDRFNQSQKIRVAIFSNPTIPAGQQVFRKYVTDVNAGILVPGVHRILGYSVIPQTGGANYGYETWLAMYDSAATGSGANYGAGQGNLNKLEAEIEFTTTTGYTFWYAYPYEIKEGVCLVIGPNATVSVYYEDYRGA